MPYRYTQIEEVFPFPSTVDYGNAEMLLSYYLDNNGRLIHNLNTGIQVIADSKAFEKFHVATDMFWPQISQKIYGTPALYWLLSMLNPEKTSTMFGKVKAPNHVMYLPNAIDIINSQS